MNLNFKIGDYMNPLFPNHKPEDADLNNIPGYTGHPGQERVVYIPQDEKKEDEKSEKKEDKKIDNKPEKVLPKIDQAELDFDPTKKAGKR